MAKKFIIITTARSGSQMLCEFLTKQENIACEYELLQSHREAKHKKGRLQSSSQFEEILGKDPSKFVGNRNRNFIEFLKIWEGMFSSEYFGFKVFFKSHLGTHKLSTKDAISYEDFAKYIKDYDIKIIHLTRNNILLKYISYKTSKITGVTSSSRGVDINSIGIDVIYREFVEWKNNLLKEEQSVVNFLNDNGIDYHHITYENLIGEDYVKYYKDILSFIGDDPNLFVDIREQGIQTKKKTNIHSLRFKISNLDDLIEQAALANDVELLDTIGIELSKN
jgi:LPS sulfotransferase NodH